MKKLLFIQLFFWISMASFSQPMVMNPYNHGYNLHCLKGDESLLKSIGKLSIEMSYDSVGKYYGGLSELEYVRFKALNYYGKVGAMKAERLKASYYDDKEKDAKHFANKLGNFCKNTGVSISKDESNDGYFLKVYLIDNGKRPIDQTPGWTSILEIINAKTNEVILQYRVGYALNAEGVAGVFGAYIKNNFQN